MRIDKTILHWYEVQRDLFIGAIRNFIFENANHAGAVNA
ncbi:hypothetical protein PsalN5692_03573 (plasmid) [Piscirickettsia salmonis]|nr:hypothetical protein PsalN5692_03573 [Piscirickettsia salmonis]